ncbi:hypothetical protein [Puniceicoccus vermicola]|uniref:Verru_Chthon cassette protein A n=1 Tax=Puniceicoccus vermicola TaxID=388746 RepID=A0A7X1E523_9BACT|nr:hypothetical protein [Puniceicoccus vermicola]MBC2602598.1 hypothetical protein [Puniceicoccus vermicola]
MRNFRKGRLSVARADRSAIHSGGGTILGSKNPGFALVIALSLMAFIVLLLFSVSVMVGVEISTAEKQKYRILARQNALLGVQVAMGDTQVALGLDTRVTATAARRDSDPYDGDDLDETTGALIVDGLDRDRQQWTGVWDAARDAEGYPMTTFRHWLVSGFSNDHVFVEADTDTGSTPFQNPLEILPGPNPVTVGLEEIASRGGFAFWVGDEGVKAKVNLSSSPVVSDSSSPSRFGVGAVDGFDWFDSNQLTEVGRVLNQPSWNLLAIRTGGQGAVDSVAQRFHDVTPYSYGVFANTIDGGLKKDLTTALFDTTDFPIGQVFGPLADLANPLEDVGGPDWDQVRSWVNTSTNSEGALLPREETQTQAGISPLIAAFQIYMVPGWRVVDGLVKLDLYAMPAVVLWNPYNVPIGASDYVVEAASIVPKGVSWDIDDAYIEKIWQGLAYSLSLDENPAGLTTDSGGSLHIGSVSFDTQEEWDHFFNDPAQFRLEGVELEPGEAVVFTPTSPIQEYDLLDPQATLSPGFRPGFAFRIPLTGRDFAYDEDLHDDNPDTYPFTYQLVVKLINNALGLQLYKDSVAPGNLLQTMVRMGNGPEWDLNSGYVQLQRAPGTGPITDLSYGAGFKLVHNYVVNLPFWNSSGARSLPDSYKWLAHFNPRAAHHGPIPVVFEKGNKGTQVNKVSPNPTFSGNFLRGDISNHMQQGFNIAADDQSVSVGSDNNYRSVLFQVSPERGELHSLGQLSQASLFRSPDENTDFKLYDAYDYARFGNQLPAYAIGNGRASPMIPLDQTEVNWTTRYQYTNPNMNFLGVHHDYSYKLNEGLWDRYFFSTLEVEGGGYEPGFDRYVLKESLSPPATMDEVAGNLMIDGPFNVNSTSVDAWKALLASYYYEDVIRSDGTTEVADLVDPESPLLRVDRPVGDAFDSGSENYYSDSAYDGYRVLLPDEIDTLAEKIVEEIKLRGPFASMAEFVNRSPNLDHTNRLAGESVDDFRLQGLLSRAIEKAELNDELRSPGTQTSYSGVPDLIPEVEEGDRSEDLPGWLSQFDLLARLGSVLTTRSDTFRVRAYGEVTDPLTGAKVSTAVCEAVMQRLPEFVDSVGNDPEDDLDSLNPFNESFGRRFVVVDLRWLEDLEI